MEAKGAPTSANGAPRRGTRGHTGQERPKEETWPSSWQARQFQGVEEAHFVATETMQATEGTYFGKGPHPA